MTFNHIQSNFTWPKVKRKNIKGVRHYVDENDNIYHSVTRVVGHDKDFSEWYERLSQQYGCSLEAGEAIGKYVMINAGNIGTKLHKMCENYLNNEFQSTTNTLPFDTPLLPTAHFHNIKPLLDRIDNIRGQEIQMFSKNMGLAGTVDCVAEFDGVPCIIDFKTSRKLKKEEWIDSYYMQATAYSLMWEENTGEKIEHLRILMTAETGENHVFVSHRDDWIEQLFETIETFKNAQH